MARNKNQGQEGLNGRQNLDDNRRNSNLNREQSEDLDMQRGNSRKGGKVGRKGNTGKSNGQ